MNDCFPCALNAGANGNWPFKRGVMVLPLATATIGPLAASIFVQYGVAAFCR